MANLLGGLITDEVKRAEQDFDSYRARSTAVIAVSTAVVGITTALIAVAAGDTTKVLPEGGEAWILTALICYAAATVLAILIHLPVKTRAAADDALQGFIDNNWDDPGWDKSIAELQVSYLKDLRKANKWFGRALLGSLVAQVLAIGATGRLAYGIVQHVT